MAGQSLRGPGSESPGRRKASAPATRKADLALAQCFVSEARDESAFANSLDCCARPGCGLRHINPPGGASGSRAEAARKKAESLAIAAVDGAAEAEARSNPAFAHGGSGLFSRAIAIVPQGAASQPISNASTPPERKAIIESPPPTASIVIELQPKAPPRAGPSPIIHARVSSFVPAANESEADEEAINAARDLVEKKLAELDPPVKYRPSANEVKNEFLRRDSRSVTTLKETTGPRAEAIAGCSRSNFT